MKIAFRVGERVRVYFVEGPHIGTIGFINLAGNMRIDFGKSIVGEDGERYSALMVHPKQCRRLVKRKKPAEVKTVTNCFACSVEQAVKIGIQHECKRV